MTRSAGGKSLEERVIALLAAGVIPAKVAEICDITPARVSQLMDSTEFKDQLLEAKFSQATQYTNLDQKLNTLEEKILDGLDKTVGMVFDPMKLARMLQVVNGAKRRGTGSLGEGLDEQPIVPLILPTKIVNTFIVNQVNQVVQAGGEDLITIQPSRMKELANEQLIETIRNQTIPKTTGIPKLGIQTGPKKGRLDTV